MSLIQGMPPKGVRPKFMEGKKYRPRVMSNPETLRAYREWARINWLAHRNFWSMAGEQPIPLTDFSASDIPDLEARGGRGDAEALVALGTMRIEQGDLAGAQRYWGRAADTGSAEAILLAGCAAWQGNSLAGLRRYQAAAVQNGFAAVAHELAAL
jgi:hypothetical protein